MRKHGRKDEVTSRFWGPQAAKPEARARILLSFGSSRQTCRWTTETRRDAVIKH